MRRIISIMFILIFLPSCSEYKENPTQTQDATVEDSQILTSPESNKTEDMALHELTESFKTPEISSCPNSMDPKWLEEEYQVPAWGGITDVTELPEYLYTKIYWETTKNDWPSIEELLSKYELSYGEINANTLNLAGMDVYENKEYLDAIALFRWATLYDPTYVYPHYNLACSGALLIEKILETDPDTFDQSIYIDKYGYYWTIPFILLDEIFSHLAITLFLDNNHLDKLKTDQDLILLNTMARFNNFVQFSQSGILWPYYGFFSKTYDSSGITRYFANFVDGRCISDRNVIAHFTESSSLMNNGFNSFFPIIGEKGEVAEGVVVNEIVFSRIIEQSEVEIVSIWKKIALEGYQPVWNARDDFYWYFSRNDRFPIFFNFTGGNYISSIENHVVATSINEKRVPNEGSVWSLVGFNIIHTSLSLPQEINKSFLVFNDGKKVNRGNADQFWDAFYSDEK